MTEGPVGFSLGTNILPSDLILLFSAQISTNSVTWKERSPSHGKRPSTSLWSTLQNLYDPHKAASLVCFEAILFFIKWALNCKANELNQRLTRLIQVQWCSAGYPDIYEVHPHIFQSASRKPTVQSPMMCVMVFILCWMDCLKKRP